MTRSSFLVFVNCHVTYFAGYSRIPIYDGEMTNVIALLNVKQLIMVDYKDEVPLKDLVDLGYFKDNLFCVFENTRLDFMFRKFREGEFPD